MKGTKVAVADPPAELMGLMYSDFAKETDFTSVTNKLFGLACEHVYGQGIVRLSDDSLLVAMGTD